MTSPLTSKLLLPLRIPELGPSLGKLITGTAVADPGGVPLTAVRYQLVTKVIESAGEARRLADGNQRAAAIASLGRAAWLAAWEEAVATTAGLLLERVADRLVRECDVVRMPKHLRGRVVPSTAERRAVTARLGSAGAGLVPVLDELERRGQAALEATPQERALLDGWHDALRTAARRLEEAWLELETRVVAELKGWDPVIAVVARWRRPLWPVWVMGTLALVLAVWLGLVLGGYVPAPGQ
ncbi:MAG: hypothetical protein HY560_10030 [Gemmatimonadetes bacterium]|nr:hypothetical protein [Gemmatimonadota bacterium]